MSNAGVAARLGILKGRARLLVGEVGLEAPFLLKDSREGCADMKGLREFDPRIGGVPGESTVTSGGERGGDRGPMDTGRSFGVLERALSLPGCSSGCIYA